MKFLSAFIKEDWQGWRPNLKNSRDWSIAKNTSTFLKLRSTYIDDVKKTSFHTYSIVSCQQWSIFVPQGRGSQNPNTGPIRDHSSFTNNRVTGGYAYIDTNGGQTRPDDKAQLVSPQFPATNGQDGPMCLRWSISWVSNFSSGNQKKDHPSEALLIISEVHVSLRGGHEFQK